MSLTTDPTTPCLREYREDGQQKCYLVLSEEERAKGFERPVRQSYRHLACGHDTSMALPLAETYARDHSFYGGTWCANCGAHFPLVNMTGERQFAWLGADHRADGSFVGE